MLYVDLAFICNCVPNPGSFLMLCHDHCNNLCWLAYRGMMETLGMLSSRWRSLLVAWLDRQMWPAVCFASKGNQQWPGSLSLCLSFRTIKMNDTCLFWAGLTAGLIEKQEVTTASCFLGGNSAAAHQVKWPASEVTELLGGWWHRDNISDKSVAKAMSQCCFRQVSCHVTIVTPTRVSSGTTNLCPGVFVDLVV